PTRRKNARSSGASSSSPSSRRHARSPRTPEITGRRSISSSRGRSTRTWWNRAAALGVQRVEPLRAFFKGEGRGVGEALGLPPEIVWRQPFPGPGLAIRIIGEVTAERLRIVSAADAIVRAELSAAGLDREIWQCPVVLLADVRSVGVQGDARSYGYP